MNIPYGWLGSRRKKLMAGRRWWPNGVGNGGPPVPPSNAILSRRGANTKANANPVNLGSLLPEPMTAISSSYEALEGNAAHWTLPTDGRHPVPTAAGVSAALAGGPYIFAYEISDGERTVSDTLTIERAIGETIPGYRYWRPDVGVVHVPAEDFTAACYTVSTTAEFSAVTAAQRSGATIMIARGADPAGLNLTSFNHNPALPFFVTSEDPNERAKIAKLIVNQGSKQRYSNLETVLSASELSALFTNSICLSVQGNPTDIRIMNSRIGARDGTAANDLPLITIFASTDTHIVDTDFVNYQSNRLNALVRPVFARTRHDRFGADAFFFGTTANEVNVDGTYDDIIIGRGVWDETGIHPDGGQFYTTAPAGQGARYTGDMSISDVRTYGADGGTSFNAFLYTGSGAGGPRLEGTVRYFAGMHAGLTTYAPMFLGGADFTLSVATELWATTAIRQVTGVTGSISGGKGSGAQGFDTHSDDGSTAVPANNQRYPGHNSTGGYPSNANQKNMHCYFDGVAPTLAGTMDISTSIYKGRGSNSTDPAGLSPAEINDNSEYFSDPNRVVDWAGKSLAEIDAIHSEMYRAKVGGPLDNGDGTYKGRWLPSGKVNQIGRTELAAYINDGVLYVTLGVSLMVDVHVTVFVDGVEAGVLTIPTEEVEASGAFGPGEITIRNDSGLHNPVPVII